MHIKMDKVFREKDLTPITHKEFNEFIKGKGFKGRNNYKLRDLKAMFGFNLWSRYLLMEQNQRDSILCQRLQPLQEYHTLPFYMPRRIPGIEFTLMEKNIQ